jgi:hypothetical protein
VSYATQNTIKARVRALAADDVTLLALAQSCRASNFTALQCAPELYTSFPATVANDMAATQVAVWGCELSGAGLTAAMQACLKSDGSRAYTDAQITQAAAAAMSMVFWDMAHVPTQYGGSNNNELKMIGLSQGDLTAIKPAEAAQFLLISCLPGDYTATPGSLIAAIQAAYGLNIATMAADPAADYRSTNHCWVSKPIPNYQPSQTVPYQRLLCFESTGANAVANIPGVFASIKQFVPNPPAIPNTGATIISALLSTGGAGANPSQVLTALFNGCWSLMTAGGGYNMTCFRIDVFAASMQQQLVTAFDQLKQSHGA